MNQILIEHLDPTAWRAKPPGKVRTIAAIFTHMHNVRSKWVRQLLFSTGYKSVDLIHSAWK